MNIYIYKSQGLRCINAFITKIQLYFMHKLVTISHSYNRRGFRDTPQYLKMNRQMRKAFRSEWNHQACTRSHVSHWSNDSTGLYQGVKIILKDTGLQISLQQRSFEQHQVKKQNVHTETLNSTRPAGNDRNMCEDFLKDSQTLPYPLQNGRTQKWILRTSNNLMWSVLCMTCELYRY